LTREQLLQFAGENRPTHSHKPLLAVNENQRTKTCFDELTATLMGIIITYSCGCDALASSQRGLGLGVKCMKTVSLFVAKQQQQQQQQQHQINPHPAGLHQSCSGFILSGLLPVSRKRRI